MTSMLNGKIRESGSRRAWSTDRTYGAGALAEDGESVLERVVRRNVVSGDNMSGENRWSRS